MFLTTMSRVIISPVVACTWGGSISTVVPGVSCAITGARYKREITARRPNKGKSQRNLGSFHSFTGLILSPRVACLSSLLLVPKGKGDILWPFIVTSPINKGEAPYFHGASPSTSHFINPLLPP